MLFPKRFMQCVVVAGAVALVAPVWAQEIPNEGPVRTEATVSVESKQPVPLDPAMVKVEVNGHETPLTGLTRVQPSSAQIAILIDDGLRSSFGIQIDDVKKFVTALPDGAQVLVGYMRNGSVDAPDGFSADHAAVATKIRIPMSVPGDQCKPLLLPVGLCEEVACGRSGAAIRADADQRRGPVQRQHGAG